MENLAPLICLIPFIIILFVYPNFKQSQDIRKTWAEFIKANNLKSEVVLSGVQMVGLYKGMHHLKIYVQSKKETTHTQFTMRTNKDISKKQVITTKKMPVKEVKPFVSQVLTFTGIFNLKGTFTTTNRGRIVSYEETGAIETTATLNIISNILSDLATNYLSIVNLGGEAIPALLTIVKQKKHPLYNVVKQMLYDIGVMTSEQIALHGLQLTCPRCFTHCGEHRVPLNHWDSISYYGCRTCGQSRKFINNPIIALLDSNMTAQTMATEDRFYVNWLIDRELFDFDRVEIKQATDEDVERFVVQIKNDTDAARKEHYKNTTYVIDPNCQLNHNTHRILERTFINN